MELHLIASGSSGNAYLLCTGRARLLIDAGISMRRITAAVRGAGAAPETLAGVLVTHAHSDHIQGLRMLEKYYRLPVYCSAACAGELLRQMPEIRPWLRTVEPLAPLELQGLRVVPFPTSHDSPGSLGWRVEDAAHSMALVTDLGVVTDAVRDTVSGAELVVLEANHDRVKLQTGPYPFYLKKRILGAGGHLCNEDSARFAVYLAQNGTKRIVLAHLSQENNTPRLALEAVCGALAAAGAEIPVTVAPRQEPAERLVL